MQARMRTVSRSGILPHTVVVLMFDRRKLEFVLHGREGFLLPRRDSTRELSNAAQPRGAVLQMAFKLPSKKLAGAFYPVSTT